MSQSPSANFTLGVNFNPHRFALLAWLFGASLVVFGAVANAIRHILIGDLDSPLANLLKRVDIVEEPSLHQWFSSSLHLILCLLLAGIGRVAKEDLRWGFRILSAIFLVASIDEAIMLHELMDRPTREFLGTSGWLSIAWIIPGSIIAICCGIVVIPFLLKLPRAIAGRFVLAGGVFLSGAILMEIPGGYLYEKDGFTTPWYIASYAVEEILEDTGLVLFLWTLLACRPHFCSSAQSALSNAES